MVDKNNLTPGFYVATGCDGGQEPLYFRVIDYEKYGPCVWGLSVFRRYPGYRTHGITVVHWLSRPENANIEIKVDHDRLQNNSWKELDQFKPKKKNRIWTCTLESRYVGSASGTATVQAPTALEAARVLRSHLEGGGWVESGDASWCSETYLKEQMKDVGFAHKPWIGVLALGAV